MKLVISIRKLQLEARSSLHTAHLRRFESSFVERANAAITLDFVQKRVRIFGIIECIYGIVMVGVC